jgi:hypothetical protein
MISIMWFLCHCQVRLLQWQYHQMANTLPALPTTRLFVYGRLRAPNAYILLQVCKGVEEVCVTKQKYLSLKINFDDDFFLDVPEKETTSLISIHKSSLTLFLI